MAEGLLFSNGAQVAKELLADGPDRLVGRLEADPDRAERVELAVRNVLSRPPDDDEHRVLAATSTSAPTGPTRRAGSSSGPC